MFGAKHRYFNVKQITSLIEKISVPHYFTRSPKDLESLDRWKANELRTMLLYFVTPLLVATKAHSKFTFLISLLSTAVYLLSDDTVTEENLKAANNMLLGFQANLCAWFGAESSTMTVHSLMHLPEQVRRLGPLWTTSASTFESFLAFWYPGYMERATKHPS
jgi:hypothetical protein